MNGNEKSDPSILAMKPTNEPGRPGKEWVERGGLASRRPSTSWALPTSARDRGGAASCWPATRDAIASRRSCWRSPEDLRRRWHQDVAEQGEWLGAVVRGFFAYHAVPTNTRALSAFRHHVIDLWRRALRRRSQTGSHDVDRDGQAGRSLAAQAPDIPSLAVSTLPRQTPKVGAVCGNSARTVLCGGRPVMGVPTAIEGISFVLALWCSQ